MGSLLSKLMPTSSRVLSNETEVNLLESPPKHYELSDHERAHLIRLGTVSGSPEIIMDAINSGNIMDPAHMQRALAMQDEWERGITMINEALRQQALREEEVFLFY